MIKKIAKYQPNKKKLITQFAVLALILFWVMYYYYTLKFSQKNVNHVHINNMTEQGDLNYRYMFRERIKKEKIEQEYKAEREFK